MGTEELTLKVQVLNRKHVWEYTLHLPGKDMTQCEAELWGKLSQK